MLKAGFALLMGVLNAAYDDTTGPLPGMIAGGQSDEYLTDVAVDAMQNDDEFITPTAFPIVQVENEAGKIKVWDRGSLIRPEMRLHSYGDRPVVGGYKTKKASYDTEHYSLQKNIAPSDVAASRRDPMRPMADAATYLAGQARLNLDLRYANTAFHEDAGWAWRYQGVSSNPNRAADTPEFLQLDQPGANPAELIRGRIERFRRFTGKKPNLLQLGVDVYASLVFNEDITDRVKYVQRGVADLDLLAAFFDVARVQIVSGVVNDAEEGQDDNIEYICDPKGMLLMYVAPNPSRETPSAGYTFNWENLYRAFEGDQERILNELALIRRGYNAETGNRWVQVHTAASSNIVAPDLGMWFSDVVSTSQSDW